jgi:hypothetical protein
VVAVLVCAAADLVFQETRVRSQENVYVYSLVVGSADILVSVAVTQTRFVSEVVQNIQVSVGKPAEPTAVFAHKADVEVHHSAPQHHQHTAALQQVAFVLH